MSADAASPRSAAIHSGIFFIIPDFVQILQRLGFVFTKANEGLSFLAWQEGSLFGFFIPTVNSDFVHNIMVSDCISS